MARTPKLPPKVAGTREGLRKNKAIDYNIHKLSEKSMVVPKETTKETTKEKGTKKKVATPAKKSTGKKATKKSSASYITLIKRILRDVEAPGLGLASIVKQLAADYGRDDRKYIRLALATGVDDKTLVKTRASWRLSKKAQDKMKRVSKKKKTTTKKPATKKAGAKKSATKKATTKKGTKKTTTKKTDKAGAKKKASTKKTTTKKTAKETTKKSASKKRAAEEEAPKSPAPKKKVIGPPAGDESGTVSEASGKWQYYDGGWQNYTDDASRIVEGVYQEYNGDMSIHVRPVQSGHFSYSVNFQTLEQTNTSTGTMRKIRRI